jgi:4-aminobutyrate aminotransferase
MNVREQYAKHILPVVAQAMEPVVVASAKGRTVVDEDGKNYLDCFSGISVVNAGHNHPKILAAAREQMEKLVHCCSYVYHVPVVGRLAEKLAAIAPGGLTKSFFANSGAEANEGAIRLAKQATGRREIVALGFGFHGRTIGTLSVTGNQARKKANGPYLPGVAFGPAPYCYRCPLGLTYPECDVACAHALKDVFRQQTSGDVAALIVEPVLGEGGIVTPPPEYFTIAARIFHEEGALFIVDEVQTGFGRTGKMFACEHWNIAPDILCVAKGIASGLPLGAMVARDEISVWTRGTHGSTFGGNPVACAAALATIEVIEAGLVENAAETGAYLREKLANLQKDHPSIGEVRGLGLMIGVDFRTVDGLGSPDPKLRDRVMQSCFERGLLLLNCGESTLRFCPALIVSRDDVDAAVDVFESAIRNSVAEPY